MKSLEFDIVIIGGGCIGSSIFQALSCRGFIDLALLDDGRKSVSATAQSGGMLRVFHESSEHLELSLASTRLLKQYQKSNLLHPSEPPNGSLYFFKKHRYASYQANLEKMDQARYHFEVLTPPCGEKMFPQFHWHSDDWAIYEPEGTQMSPAIFVEDLLKDGLTNGATLIDDFPIQRLSRHHDHFRIFGTTSIVKARTLILAGGARLLPRLHDLGLSIPLEEKTLTTFITRKSEVVTATPNFFDRETLEFAGFSHPHQAVLSRPSPQRMIKPMWIDPMEKRSAPDCYAPHRLGLLGQIPGVPQLLIATGWGGTAFKFALEIGNRAASLVERTLTERKYIHAGH